MKDSYCFVYSKYNNCIELQKRYVLIFGLVIMLLPSYSSSIGQFNKRVPTITKQYDVRVKRRLSAARFVNVHKRFGHARALPRWQRY